MNKFQRKWIWILFLGPSLGGFALFYLLPFLQGVYYSLIDHVFSRRFIGLENYINLFKGVSFRLAWKNTVLFISICVPLNLLLSLILAMLLNKKLYFRKIFRTSIILPLVVPVASVVLFWNIIFDNHGFLNYIFDLIGLDKIDWLSSNWALMIIVILYLWKNVGYSMVLFLAGLQNIPVEYYEVAKIEGASKWQIFRHIKIVYLTPMIFFVFIFSIINSFKVFREIYLMSGSYPHRSIYMLQHYMNNVFISLDYQKITSAAFVTALVIYLLVLILFIIERKIGKKISL